MKDKKRQLWKFLPLIIFALHIPLALLYFFGNFGKGYVGLWSVLVLLLAVVYVLLVCFKRMRSVAFLSFAFAILQAPPIWGWSLVGVRFVPAGPGFVKYFPGTVVICIHFLLIALAVVTAKKAREEGERADDVP